MEYKDSTGCGRSSVVERHLAKVDVVSSSLIARSIFLSLFPLLVLIIKLWRLGCFVSSPSMRSNFFSVKKYFPKSICRITIPARFEGFIKKEIKR